MPYSPPKPLFDPSKESEVVAKPAFDPSKYSTELDQNLRPMTSGGESIIRGAAHGFTGGFSDEIAGIAGATGKTLFSDKKFSDFLDTYRKERDESRANNEKARQDNPNLYMAGEIGGTIGTALVPGLGEARGAAALSRVGEAAVAGAAKKEGVSLLSRLGKASLMGGIMGAGTSEADLTKGDIGGLAGDVAIGGATGAATTGLLSGLGSAAKAVTPKNIAKKAANIFLGAPEEALNRYIDNPEAVNAAKPMSQLAKDFSESVDKLKQDVRLGSAGARKTLEGETVDGNVISQFAKARKDQLVNRMEGVSDNPKVSKVVGFLDNVEQQYKDKTISASRAKDFIQNLDDMTNFEVAPGQFNEVGDVTRKGLRKEIDGVLKTNDAYKEAMVQTAKDAELLNSVNGKTKDLDTLTNYFRSVARGKKEFGLQDLRAYDQARGTNFAEAIKDTLTKEAFDKSAMNGSRNVNFYSKLADFGESTNFPFGKQIGALIGGGIDKYGPKMAMKAVDTATMVNDLWNKSPYLSGVNTMTKKIMDYVKRGDPGAVLTFQLLSHSNPDLMKNLPSQGLQLPTQQPSLALPGR